MKCHHCQKRRKSTDTYCQYCGIVHRIPPKKISLPDPHQIGDPSIGATLSGAEDTVEGCLSSSPIGCLLLIIFTLISPVFSIAFLLIFIAILGFLGPLGLGILH